MSREVGRPPGQSRRLFPGVAAGAEALLSRTTLQEKVGQPHRVTPVSLPPPEEMRAIIETFGVQTSVYGAE